MSSTIDSETNQERLLGERLNHYRRLADGKLDSSLGELGEEEARTIRQVAKTLNGLRVSGDVESGSAFGTCRILIAELETMPDEIRSAQSLIVEARVRVEFARTLWCYDALYASPDVRDQFTGEVKRVEELIDIVLGGASSADKYPRAQEGLATPVAQNQAMNIKLELDRVKLADEHLS